MTQTTRTFEPASEALWQSVEAGNIPTLLMVLVSITGDQRWLGARYRPSPTKGLGDNDSGGLPGPIQHEIRGAAYEAISAWIDGAPMALEDPSPDVLTTMMSVAMGENVPDEYGPMLKEGLTHLPLRDRIPRPRKKAEDVDVLIIGAGISGILAAAYLKAADFPFTILERHEEVGGTWLENRYPGCGVDTPSHLYSYSFFQNDWEHYFPLRDEILEYVIKTADGLDIRPHIRFGCEAQHSTFDEDSKEWVTMVQMDDGTNRSYRSRILITAVGAFNEPKWPNIPGLESFEGEVAHTARWPTDLSIAGKDVAVVGSGASAMQLVPAIARQVSSLTVFQRTPQWAAPFDKHLVKVPQEVRQLLAGVPSYSAWYRLRLGWIFGDRLHRALQIDPEWPHLDRTINAANEGHRDFFIRHIRAELGDRTDLLEKAVPSYPPFGKRILLDNGWYRALTLPNVELVTESVAQVDAHGVHTEDGAYRPVDVVALATGFDVVSFLSPIDVFGRDGLSLHRQWEGDNARAYLGSAVPNFPNFFTLYGPNTQTGHGGSLIYQVEMQMHYVMDLLSKMVDRGIDSVEVQADVHDAYNSEVDDAHSRMIWSHRGMETYYRNSQGRIVVNSPFTVLDFWYRTRSADLSNFITTRKRCSGGHDDPQG